MHFGPAPMHAQTEVAGAPVMLTEGAQRCVLIAIPLLRGHPVLRQTVITEAACFAATVCAWPVEHVHISPAHHFHLHLATPATNGPLQDECNTQ